jgi:hypothetical protein
MSYEITHEDAEHLYALAVEYRRPLRRGTAALLRLAGRLDDPYESRQEHAVYSLKPDSEPRLVVPDHVPGDVG